MYHLIVNATKVKTKQINKVLEVFKKAGKECALHTTMYKGHAKVIAREITSEEEDCTIAVMGGDGTLHEVLNGIKDVSKVSLGLIPHGTGNDFAAAAKITKDIVYSAQTIAYKEPTHIDYIELEGGLRSINAVGMGIDVDVLKHAYSGGKKSSYLKSLIHCLRHFKKYDFTVSYNGITEKRSGLIAALGNGRQIGGGIKLFPEAELSDGYMNMLIVDYLSGWQTIKAFVKLMTGRINKIKGVTALKVKEATFTPEKPCTIQAEGELYLEMDIKAHIVEKGLKFYLPDIS